MLDEPTDSTTTPADAAETPPAKKAPRKRATRKAAAPAAGQDAATGTTPDEAAPEVAPEADTVAAPAADPEAAPAPAKRTRARKATKAVAETPEAPEAAAEAPAEPVTPAKKAPRKRATRKAAAPEVAPEPTPEPEVAAEDEAAAAALLDAGEPVVDAVEDDPAVVEAAVQDVTSEALATEGTPASRSRRGRGRRASAPAAAPAELLASAPPELLAPAETPAETPSETAPAAEDEDVPAPRSRRRRAPAVVTFVAPDEVLPPSATAAPAAPSADAPSDDAPAPRRRRRAGTSAATAPADLPAAEEAPVGDGPAAETDADDDEDSDRPRRRRRGRRGRGPRRDDETAEGTDETSDQTGEAAEGETAEGDDDEQGELQADGTRRRRRRRRRSGAGGGEDDAADDVPTVVHVREPRAPRQRGTTAADEDGVRGITGSTRMAAKRVRRQEGRDSGRGRKALLTEAEFLARREAVQRDMVVRQKGDMTQIAVLEDGILVEHFVTKASAESYAGNVYLGRVQNVLPSMEAAFVDIGKGRNGVLYAGEVNYEGGGKNRSIESVLKSGQEVLVQVSKDPIGHKGARLTSQVSLPGRYLVYVPEGSMTGISRKLPEGERARLKSILKKVVPDTAGVIIRTAAEGASEEEIAADVRRLQAQWEVIQEKAAKGGAPKQLQAEPDLVVRVVRDVFNEDFTSLVVQGESEWDTIRDYVEFVAPDLADRVKRHVGNADVFAEHRIDEQLLKALDRKVHLPSGGSLVIDRTEAMVVIDVNTGKYVGKGGNLEETVTRNNLEAAEEIARQLRLRDLGGIIVVDFIDMVLESNRDLVVRRLVECLGRDRTKHQVAEVTSLGLVQMTRKRVGQGLLESFSETCPSCDGRGVHVRTDVTGSPAGTRASDGGAGIERVAAALKKAEPAAPSDDDAPAAEEGAPKRRRRGGRGRGASTVAPQDEMSELLAEPAGSEIPPEPVDEPVADAEGEVQGEVQVETDTEVDAVADASASVAADPAAGSAPVAPEVEPEPEVEPDVVPELADQPTPAEEDLPVVPDLVQSVVEPETELRPDLVEFGNEPEVEARPRRRRRATSRPAGAPEQ